MNIDSQPAQKSIKGLKVIVVDDILDSRDIVEMFLSQEEAQVQSVSCAKDALNILGKFQPELIISDIYMPGEDGYWLIKQLNTINQNSTRYIRAIALTAAAKEEDRQHLLSAGYDGYLTKPFLFEDLIALIARIVT